MLKVFKGELLDKKQTQMLDLVFISSRKAQEDVGISYDQMILVTPTETS